MVITVNDPDLKNLTGEEITLLAAACVNLFENVDMGCLKDVFIFEMQNIIIKHDLVTLHFGDPGSLSYKFQLMKSLLDGIESVEKAIEMRQDEIYIKSIKTNK